MANTGETGLKSKDPRASPRPEDAAAGRPNGWKADLRQGVRIYPEKMTGLQADRVIIKEAEDEAGSLKMNSIYRVGFTSGVEALAGLKGIKSAGKGLEVAQERDQRGDFGGPLVWDKSALLKNTGLDSIYSKSFLRPPSSARQHKDSGERAAGLTATEETDRGVKTSRCVETIGAAEWQKLVRSEYQAENNKEALERSHRSRAKAKGMTQDEREQRWMKCFLQNLTNGDEDDAERTTTATGLSGVAKTSASGATDFSILPSGYQFKQSQEIRARNLSYGRLRLHMYDEAKGEAVKKGEAPYAVLKPTPENGLDQLCSVYGADFVAHIGKQPALRRKKKKKFIDK